MRDAAHDCARNASVCSTHTLPRSLLYDPELKAHVTPPIPQTELLRKAKLHSIATSTKLEPNVYVPFPAAVEASGMQVRLRTPDRLNTSLCCNVSLCTWRSFGATSLCTKRSPSAQSPRT